MRQGASRGLQDAVSGLDFATHFADRHFLNVLSHFFLIFTNSLCFAVQSGPPCAKTQFFTVYYGARRNRQVALRVAKTSRILYFCLNFFNFQDSGKISSTVGLEAKLDTQRRPGDPTLCLYNALPRPHFLLVKFFVVSTLLAPCWNPVGALLWTFRNLLAVFLGSLLGASWKLLRVFLKLPWVLTTKFH